jgi:hypothetical protein
MSAAHCLKYDAERIGNIAARIASPHDGEALTAARMTVRHLEDMGLRIGDVVRDGIPTASSQPRSSYSPPPVNPLRAWQRDAWQVLACASSLTDWEREFLKTIKERRAEPTDKQSSTLAALLARTKAEQVPE